jgi:hypothetical protein
LGVSLGCRTSNRTFVLAAANDKGRGFAHATAIKSRCRTAIVAIRVEPGHLSLFMGRRTLAGTWRDIAEWLKEDDAGRPVGPIRVGCSKK